MPNNESAREISSTSFQSEVDVSSEDAELRAIKICGLGLIGATAIGLVVLGASIGAKKKDAEVNVPVSSVVQEAERRELSERSRRIGSIMPQLNDCSKYSLGEEEIEICSEYKSGRHRFETTFMENTFISKEWRGKGQHHLAYVLDKMVIDTRWANTEVSRDQITNYASMQNGYVRLLDKVVEIKSDKDRETKRALESRLLTAEKILEAKLLEITSALPKE